MLIICGMEGDGCLDGWATKEQRASAFEFHEKTATLEGLERRVCLRSFKTMLPRVVISFVLFCFPPLPLSSTPSTSEDTSPSKSSSRSRSPSTVRATVLSSSTASTPLQVIVTKGLEWVLGLDVRFVNVIEGAAKAKENEVTDTRSKNGTAPTSDYDYKDLFCGGGATTN
ncbi:hypothetical protein JOM56_009672 [Amanita muscaria]